MSRNRAPAVAAALGLLLLAATGVTAHASLVDSEPSAGGTIEATPATLTATFDEDLGTDRSRIVVFNAADIEVARGGISPDERVMMVELPALPPGPYEARWTAVTPEDGGVTRGVITFAVSQPPSSPGATVSASPTASPTERPQGIPVITAPPGTTPPPPRAPTASPSTVPSPSPTLAPAPTLAAFSPSPTPAETASETDLLVALMLAGIAVAGLAVYLVRRGG